MLKLTVVMDNMVPATGGNPIFIGEAGLSYLIEYDGKKILFDTGETGAVLHNLSLLGIHPSQLDIIILSHNHHDHTGGMLHLLQHRGKEIPVYANNGIFGSHYAITPSSRRFIGVPFSEQQLTALGADWRLADTPQEILSNLIFSGKIPRKTDFEKGSSNFKIVEPDGHEIADIVEDDACLFYKVPEGLVVIGGCTHSGVVNTVEYGLEITGTKRLVGWIGGTHLGPASKEQQEKTLEAFASYRPDFVATSHCTGFYVMAELERRFADKFRPAMVGTVFEI